MKKSNFLTLVLCIGLLLPFAYGGCNPGGGSDWFDIDDDSGSSDPCTGPVPCLTTAFGNTGYEFESINGGPSVVLSDGKNIGYSAYIIDAFGDPYPIYLTGSVVSCHDGDFTEGWIDWNLNSTLDIGESLAAIDGEINICNITLTIYDLVVEGQSYDNYTATYVGTIALGLGTSLQQSTESQQTILNELLTIMSTE